ncbi:MAG: cation transporter [Armatimonadetes bacterium]|nr:cation transporter [Armatimonadota bacterium]
MKNILSIAGIALAGLGASACCWIPALLGAGAAGSLGIGAALTPYRPYFLILTGVFLIFGFTMVYRKPSAASCDATGCLTPQAAVRRKINKGVMWAVAIFALSSAAYPYVGQARLNMANAASESNQQASTLPTQRLVFNVEGMDCAACAIPIMEKVEEVPGVMSATVDFDAEELVVQAGTPAPATDMILKAVDDAGFTAEPVSDEPSQ